MTWGLGSIRSGDSRAPRRLLVPVLAIVALLGGTTAADADDLTNNLDTTVDADLEALNLQASGASSSVKLTVMATDGDGRRNCNLTGQTSVTFSISSSNPVVATVSHSSITFTSCNEPVTITVTPLASGTSTVSLTVTGNTSGGTFNSAPATFTVNVAPAPAPACPASPTSAPQVIESNAPDATSGWYNSSSLAAAFTISPGANAEYSLNNGSSWLPYTGEVAFSSDGIRSVIARSFRPASAGCARVDGPVSAVKTLRVDRTAPVLSLAVAPELANAAGWNKTEVVVDWTCTEGGSGLVGACPADVTYGHGTNVAAENFSVSDVAGNSSTLVNRRAVKVDTVAPTLSAAVPAANAAGWNNTLVTVDWDCTDGTSGFSDPTPCPTDESFGEADSPVAERSVRVSDLAGNETPFTRRSIKIDVTQPSAAVAVAPDAVGDGWNNSDVTADYTCADGGAGLHSTTPCPTDETFSAEGVYPAVTFSVKDNAGNTSAASTRRQVKIDKTAPAVTVQLRDAAGTVIAPNANGWFNQTVTVDYTCTDPTSAGVTSGVATTGMPCPADHTLTNDGEHGGGSYNVADNAGNTTSGVVPTVRIDTTAPLNQVLGITQGSSFTLGTAPSPTCLTTDGGSGVARSAAVSITGGNSGGVGLFTASCTGGMDNAGNAAGTVSVTYTVGYNFLGFFQPINDPATASTQSSFKRGSTIPVKFAVANSAGTRISDADGQALASQCGARLFWAKASTTGGGASETVNSNPANVGSCFRYDAATDQFVYNLGTKDFTTGNWTLIAKVFAGGSEHTVHMVNVSVQ